MSTLQANNYLIYEVLYKGKVVYIGSGLPDRPKHVKSGKSHNINLNQLFFTDPDNVVISILRENLSQEESLEMEKDYIQAYEPEFNIVHTKKHKQAILNGKKSKSRRKSYRSKD